MTNRTENQSFDEAEGRALWRRAAGRLTPNVAPSVAPSDDDTLLLAAHLDGRLNPREQEAFEVRLAAEPALLELFLQADGAIGARISVGSSSTFAPGLLSSPDGNSMVATGRA